VRDAPAVASAVVFGVFRGTLGDDVAAAAASAAIGTVLTVSRNNEPVDG
jgi:hypothetical protein